MPAPVEPTVLGPWPVGINNRLAPFALTHKQLRNAVNVDLDSQGDARRRSGYTAVYNGVALRDAYACPAGVFFVEGFVLKALNANNTATALDGNWVGPVCYEFFNNVVYLSDGIRTARIVNGAIDTWEVDPHLQADTDYITMPPCSILKQHNGRLYGAVDKVVWFTDPYTLGSIHRHRGFFQFSEAVTVIEPVTNGIWIVADKTYFYAGGGPDTFDPKLVFEYGALPGTSQRVPNSNDVMWTSIRGVVMADASGQAKNLQEENVAVETGVAGASIIREEDGVRQFITTIRSPTVSPLAAKDWIAMEIVRKG